MASGTDTDEHANVAVIIPGRGPQAGVHRGRDAVIDLFRWITRAAEWSR